MAGRPDLEEEELYLFLCRSRGRRKKRPGQVRAKRMGQALPSRMYLSFVFPFIPADMKTFSLSFFLSLSSPLSGGSWGEGDLGHPTMTAQAGPG